MNQKEIYKDNDNTNGTTDKNEKHHISKRTFSPSEDQILIRYIYQNGPKNWGMLANVLPGRTPKQCRERWHNHLDPRINKGPWTLEEDKILAEKQKILGNKWSDIAKFLPGRTDTLVKNRWNTSVKGRLDELFSSTRTTYKQPKQVKKETNEIEKEKVMNVSDFLDSFKKGETNLPVTELLSIPPLLSNNIHH